jgi:hypothetical protein
MADGDLTAPLVLEYPYTRTVGDVLGHWFTGLRDGRIEGIRANDGRVLVPPQEYDPVTSETLSEWVPVGTSGQVLTWTWVPAALEDNPLDRPFAWALIRLDGADTGLLHAVDAGTPERMATGMRVQVKWRAETEGSIRDIECFVPEEST